jgi:hypothetical protein
MTHIPEGLPALDERARFEAWALHAGLDVTWRSSRERYVETITQYTFEAWQARATLPADKTDAVGDSRRAQAEHIVAEAIKRLRAAHVGCADLVKEAEGFLQGRSVPSTDAVGVPGSGPMQFFAQNVDQWGAAEWFDRLAKAIRAQDEAVRSGNAVLRETCQFVAASSAMSLVREFEQEVRSALSRPAAPSPAHAAVAYISPATLRDKLPHHCAGVVSGAPSSEFSIPLYACPPAPQPEPADGWLGQTLDDLGETAYRVCDCLTASGPAPDCPKCNGGGLASVPLAQPEPAADLIKRADYSAEAMLHYKARAEAAEKALAEEREKVDSLSNALRACYVAERVASELPGVSGEYDFGPTIVEAERVLKAVGALRARGGQDHG